MASEAQAPVEAPGSRSAASRYGSYGAAPAGPVPTVGTGPILRRRRQARKRPGRNAFGCSLLRLEQPGATQTACLVAPVQWLIRLTPLMARPGPRGREAT